MKDIKFKVYYPKNFSEVMNIFSQHNINKEFYKDTIELITIGINEYLNQKLATIKYKCIAKSFEASFHSERIWL